ncbi:hypothetical protein FHT19_004873 [Novosphingobium sp. SG919]|nr:hypothetical protein [Novosphingobium sp. SG919]
MAGDDGSMTPDYEQRGRSHGTPVVALPMSASTLFR